jgi:hypothetical protein
MKRIRTESDGGEMKLAGREQLLLNCFKLQTSLGKKYCDESELLPLLLEQGLVKKDGTTSAGLETCPDLQACLGKKSCDRADLLGLLLACSLVQRVRTITVEIRPLGGDSFNITLNAKRPTVGKVKVEISCLHGTPEHRQELYKVAVNRDGSAVREEDAEPEVLEDCEALLADGDIVALAVAAMSLPWRIRHDEMGDPTQDVAFTEVELVESGCVATMVCNSELADDCEECALITTGKELSEGRHYWEVELLEPPFSVGVSRPGASAHSMSVESANPTASLWPDLDEEEEAADQSQGSYEKDDRVGMLLDLDAGALYFFKNGVQHGPCYPPGTVTGPVVASMILCEGGESARMLGHTGWPAGE